MKKISIFLVLMIVLLSLQNGFAQSRYTLTKKIRLSGDGKWDYLKMDENSNRLFVSHFDRVHVIDTKSETEIKTISNLNGVHGIALAVEFNEGFISNGKDNVVSVFNYKTLDSITTIKLSGQKADAIMYDGFSKKIWVFCGKTNNAMVIDPKTNRVVETVEVGEVPEFAVSDNKGMLYDNAEDGNSVMAIDTKQNKVTKTFPLQGKAAPTGLAIDLKNNVLFSTCAETKVLTVLDAKNGKIITSLPISNKVDAVAFDAKTKLIFCSGGDGITTIIKQINKTKYQIVESLKTQVGAKTLALDADTHKLYFSIATYKEGTKDVMPDTFTVLVYSK